MENAVERQQLLSRLVALNGGRETSRALYEHFSLEGLRRAVDSAEVAARDTARYGRLGAIWRSAEDKIIRPADLVDDTPAKGAA